MKKYILAGMMVMMGCGGAPNSSLGQRVAVESPADDAEASTELVEAGGTVGCPAVVATDAGSELVEATAGEPSACQILVNKQVSYYAGANTQTAYRQATPPYQNAQGVMVWYYTVEGGQGEGSDFGAYSMWLADRASAACHHDIDGSGCDASYAHQCDAIGQ